MKSSNSSIPRRSNLSTQAAGDAAEDAADAVAAAAAEEEAPPAAQPARGSRWMEMLASWMDEARSVPNCS